MNHSVLTYFGNEDLFEYLRWNSYRSPKYKLFYVATPKVACTTLKWWFSALEGYSKVIQGTTNSSESDPELIIHDTFYKVAPEITGLPPESLLEILSVDSYFRFAVVRNPYKRIFSAWQSKLLLQEPLQIGPYVSCDFFNKKIENLEDISESFEWFLEHLAIHEAPSFWDPHWTPQAALLRPDLINYSKLVRIEHVDELSNALADRLGNHIPNPFSFRRKNESLIPYLPEFITARSSELICALYAEDFDRFEYEKHPPKAKDSFSADQFSVALQAIQMIRGRHRRLGEYNQLSSSLNQAVAERDDKVSVLNQAVAERDDKVSVLNQAVAERDEELNNVRKSLDLYLQAYEEVQLLRQERIEDAKKIAELCHQATELQILRNSRLWRLRDTIRLEPLSIGKALRIARLSLSLSTPYPLRRRISAIINKGVSSVVLPVPTPERSEFDPDFYVQIYPDVAAAGIDPHSHYLSSGKSEGRLGKPPIPPGIEKLTNLGPHQETVLVVCHEGSRTGAPILGYNIVKELLLSYNVVALFFGDGPILEACSILGAVTLGPTGIHSNPIISDLIIADILKYTPLRFAIINSVEARFPLAALARHHIPTVSLLHEFAAYTRPSRAFPETIYWSDVTIFSSRLTRENALATHRELQQSDFKIIPQGRCVLPGITAVGEAPATVLSSTLRPADFPPDGIVVLGLGTVQLRKGVDLFLDCASRVLHNLPDLPIRFVWIGKGYDPNNDTQYSVYLADQIQRAGLTKRIEFLDEMEDLHGAYAAADILLLSSRLDPLPNVAIDAIAEGLPVLCFDEATGIADILREHGFAEYCVAPYLDTTRMAEQVQAIACSPKLRLDLTERLIHLASEIFQMSQYVQRIVSLAEAQKVVSQQTASDIATIINANILQLDHALGSGTIIADAGEAALRYVRAGASGVAPRKPFPGFHPGVYREVHGLTQPEVDPLADYLRQGCPEGPWLLPLITPASPSKVVHGQRIALHLHAFYPDLVGPILDALEQNKTPMDLLVSVIHEQDQQRLAPLFQNYQRGRVDVRIVPNRGRDLGPFFTEFADTIRQNYDIIGHVHTKKSTNCDESTVRQWVTFLHSNLLGRTPLMADRILSAMACDPRLGMVFPDDPNILSWGENRPYAEILSQRLGMVTLPKSIVFPVGSMFWARVAALEPLFSLGLSWSDYPAEPVPYDGTMLHALERLMPMVAIKAGYTLALSHVPGITR